MCHQKSTANRGGMRRRSVFSARAFNTPICLLPDYRACVHCVEGTGLDGSDSGNRTLVAVGVWPLSNTQREQFA